MARAEQTFSGFLREVRVEQTSDSADTYALRIPAIRSLRTLALDPRVTFFVGENGSGKSTLIEAIAIAAGFNAEGGSRNFKFSTRASESTLHQHIRLVRNPGRPRTGYFLRAESLFNVATQIDDLGVTEGYGGRSLHEQSHGESFLALLMQRFGPRGLYLLDEPEAALSPQRQLACLRRMYDLVLAGSQFIVATHSPILMAFPEATIYHLSADGLERVAYADTEHYQLTRAFMQAPSVFLKKLLSEPQD